MHKVLLHVTLTVDEHDLETDVIILAPELSPLEAERAVENGKHDESILLAARRELELDAAGTLTGIRDVVVIDDEDLEDFG